MLGASSTVIHGAQTRNRMPTEASVPDGDIACFAMLVSSILPALRQLPPTLYLGIFLKYVI